MWTTSAVWLASRWWVFRNAALMLRGRPTRRNRTHVHARGHLNAPRLFSNADTASGLSLRSPDFQRDKNGKCGHGKVRRVMASRGSSDSIGAQERTRTSTPLRELAPEASASANSATWASISAVSLNNIAAGRIVCQRSTRLRRGVDRQAGRLLQLPHTN
jgi:hypothetical protein